MNKLLLQDLIVNLDDITKLENSEVFNLSPMIKRPIDGPKPGMVAQMTFEMSLDQTVVTRSGYTILDVLADIGGFQRVLYSFFSVIAYVLNTNNFDGYLASKLYKLSGTSKNFRQDQTGKEDYSKSTYTNSEISNYFEHKEISSLKEFFGKFMPKNMLCKSCKKSKR